MTKCTKSKGENEVYLCNLPVARAILKTSSLSFFYNNYIIFFLKNQINEKIGMSIKFHAQGSHEQT